jgi:uncharacterized protein (TIGR02231 family)
MNSLLIVVLLTLNVESRIDSVIAYPDQAIVIRKATVNLAGTEQLAFGDLTGTLDDNTVRIKAEGLRIGEVQVRPGYLAKPTGRVKLLEDSLERLRTQDRTYADEQEVLKAKETFLNSIKLGAPELISKELAFGRVDAASWGSALGFLGAELVKVKARKAELERIRSELGKIVTAVSRELSNARARDENRKTILVDVAADQSGPYDVTLSYGVPSSVSWSPYYELRASPSEQKVNVTYFARIGQRTNEDWNNAKLILSTGRPSAGGVAPEPQAWYLNIYEPIYSTCMRGKAAAMPAPPAMSGEMDMMEEKAAEQTRMPPVETGISLQYVIPGRVSLKSGEDPKKLFLHDAKLPVEFAYYAYPRVEETAYLRGKLQNNTDYIFLAGQGNTYVGDEFTGRTYLGSIAPGESADLSFGVDDRVKVKRELIKSLTSRSGLLANRTKVEFVYKTTVENYHSKPVRMTLVEQIPISQNKEIGIVLGRLEPKPDETNKDLGTFKFKIELKPQEKFKVDLAYSVEYPTGKQISGLY